MLTRLCASHGMQHQHALLKPRWLSLGHLSISHHQDATTKQLACQSAIEHLIRTPSNTWSSDPASRCLTQCKICDGHQYQQDPTQLVRELSAQPPAAPQRIAHPSPPAGGGLTNIPQQRACSAYRINTRLSLTGASDLGVATNLPFRCFRGHPCNSPIADTERAHLV
jgi:hypothetical protein